MAYEDMFSVFDQTFGAPDEEEESGFAVGMQPGQPLGQPDLNAQMFAINRDLIKTTGKHDQIRQQQLERATQALQQRQIGPTLSERLLMLSAAFAQPSRTRGLAGVLGNVMPVLAAQTAAQRQGEQSRADQLLELEQAYQEQQMRGQQQGLTQQLALLKAQIAASKPQRPQRMMHPTEGPVEINPDGTYKVLQRAGSGGGSLPQPRTPQEAAMLPPGTEFLTPDGKVRRVPGGPTGSAPSGGFRSVPSGNPLDPRTL